MNGIQEVSGSIPLISTKTKGQTEVCFFVLVGVLPVVRLREAECGAFRSGIAAEHDHREYPAALRQKNDPVNEPLAFFTAFLTNLLTKPP